MGYRGNPFVQKLCVRGAMALLGCVALLPAWPQTAQPELPNPGTTILSRQQQQQLGLQAAAEVYKQMPILPDDSPQSRYVRQVGQQLVAVIPPQYSWPFRFHVVAQKEINAFALPGGQMFVNLGTITAAASEAELAGVMAHEMAHVYMQHSARQMQKAQLTQGLAGLAGAILGGRGGTLGSLGQAGIQIGAGMVMLKYSRSDEAQADSVGAVILYRARYNPQALADFFKKLEAQGSTGPQFLSDHPNPGNREAAIQKQVQGWSARTYRADNAAFAAARQQALKVKAYTSDEIAQGAKTGRWNTLNRKNGAVLTPTPGISAPAGAEGTQPETPGVPSTGGVDWKDVAPGSSFVLADLGLVTMVRPQNWIVLAPQNEGQPITVAPRAGMAGGAIGYGVVLNGVRPSSPSMTLDQATAEIVRTLQKDAEDLVQVGQTAVIRIAGRQGRSLDLQSTSPFPDSRGQPQREKDRLITIPRDDGTVVFLILIAPEQDFSRLTPTFGRMLSSLQL